MPTIPLPEPDDQADLRTQIVRALNRTVGADQRINFREIAALVVVTTAAVLNTQPGLALAGGIAAVFLALEVARKR